MDQNVKNCEGSETSTYFQANDLCRPNFMDTSGRHKTPESETKDDLLATEIVIARESALHYYPKPNVIHGVI